MSGHSADPKKIRDESKKWFGRAEAMGEARQQTDRLYLGITAFFPGGMTEAAHKAKYDTLLDAAVHRLTGAAIEFELIGMTLNDIASGYEDGDQVTATDFAVTEEQVERATDAHTPAPPSGGGGGGGGGGGHTIPM